MSSDIPGHQEEWRHLGVPTGGSCLYPILFCVSARQFVYPTIKSHVLTIRYDEGLGNSTNVDTRNSETQKEINHAIGVRRMMKATT